ncbi:phosphoglycerate kinase [hydrocarbon metagenome]|uniref:phosphoglycerate kinase n=1 Tax=hydrocarbon metagenome TaxID=938273 RepID=A0A0W8E5E6_9ZZZZ
MRSLRDLEIKGKRVLMRVDFNVPTDKENNILNDAKITAALPTIQYVLQQGGRLILMSHLGRPQGKRNGKYSLDKVAEHLASLLNMPVIMADDCLGEEVQEKAQKLQDGQVLLLQNVRYYEGEEKNDSEFSRQLASLGDVFVNDAFGTAHRAHSSTTGIADYLPAYAGFLMENEVAMLRKALQDGMKPRMAILGGAKVADKLGLIHNLLDKMDTILIGGGMANTFLKAQGKPIGKSICEDGLLEEARKLMQDAQIKGVRLVLPQDVVVADEISAQAAAEIVTVDEVSENKMILDIGPKTIENFKNLIKEAQTVVWNGPLGVFEYEQFANGTMAITRALADSPATTVIGGGDTSVIVHDLGLEAGITHISTGGGATLEFLEGIALPGVAVCEN